MRVWIALAVALVALAAAGTALVLVIEAIRRTV